ATRAEELRKAVETSAEFPWINDPDTGLMRLLRPEEICQRCSKRAVVRAGVGGQDSKWCRPCREQVIAERRKEYEERQKSVAMEAAKREGSALSVYYLAGTEVVRIGYDGTVTVADGVPMDEAARAFWNAVKQNAPT